MITMAMSTTMIFMPAGTSAAMATIIPMPMITVSFITAIADDHLVPATPVTCITVSESCMVHPWGTLIYNNFIPMIYIIVTIWAG